MSLEPNGRDKQVRGKILECPGITLIISLSIVVISIVVSLILLTPVLDLDQLL